MGSAILNHHGLSLTTGDPITARRHHYLPQCYLKGFVRHRETPKLFVVDAKKKAAFTTNPLNVAQVRDFHRVDVEGMPPDALEAALGGFESELAPSLEKIVATQSLADERDRILLLNLAAIVDKGPGTGAPFPTDVRLTQAYEVSLQLPALASSLYAPVCQSAHPHQGLRAGALAAGRPSGCLRLGLGGQLVGLGADRSSFRRGGSPLRLAALRRSTSPRSRALRAGGGTCG